jgi:hypothetical protein
MHARSTGGPELLQAQRRRREAREPERAAPPRRARRRRQSTPWLQRNALSVAAVSILIACLGLGFGLLQMVNRPEAPIAASTLSLAQSDLPASTAIPAVLAAGVTAFGPGLPAGSSSASAAGQRAIQANAHVLEPNYTIAPGDTLVKIAQRFNTSVERVQAFNNLADPRTLRIGARLVIPPAL